MTELPAGPHQPSLPRWLPLVLLVVVAIAAFVFGWNRLVSFETVIRHHGALHGFIHDHQLAAVALFCALYVATVALSLPGATILTLTGGFLFGGLIGGAAAVVSATLGATIVFMIAASAIGERLLRRAGPAAERLAKGFREDAFYYLLFLRLVPVFPFFLVNLVPALAGVRLSIFVSATAIGIIPGTFAFGFLGAGLDSVLRMQAAAFDACLAAGSTDCRFDFDLRAVITPELIAALAALGVVALIPVGVKRWRGAAP